MNSRLSSFQEGENDGEQKYTNTMSRHIKISIRIVVPTYHQDEDDQDAHHQAIQDDNPTITKLIHVEYSLDDISKPKTPIVIEEDEKLMVEITTKLYKVPMEDKKIMPEE
ncbi:hypothetical protein Tco_1097751, partial [Tanacetum coccineum]